MYGGDAAGGSIQIETLRSMARGDTCNSLRFSMPCHAGTHVDLPAHFVQGGDTIEAFSADQWLFRSVAVLHLSEVGFGQSLAPAIPPEGLNPGLELLLVKTGFGRHRGTAPYWEAGPVFLPEWAHTLRCAFPNLRAVGMDAISLSSWTDRTTGHMAHRQFLGGERPLLLIEDMDLSALTPGSHLERVVVAPLRLRQADGVPCTVIAEGVW